MQKRINLLLLLLCFGMAASAQTSGSKGTLLLAESFEGSYTSRFQAASNPAFNFYNPYYRIFATTRYGFSTPAGLARKGGQAARFEMRRADTDVVRSELAGKKTESALHNWYAVSLYLPSESWGTDKEWDIITQFNTVADAGEPKLTPPVKLFVDEGRLYLSVNWAAAKIAFKPEGSEQWDLGPVEKDKWLDFVWHINFSFNPDGVLELWKNGVKVVNYRGPNMYNDNVVPWFKYGIYRRKWASVHSRVLYADEVRIMSGNVSYSDIAPEGAAAASKPEPESVVQKPATFNPILLNVGGKAFTDSKKLKWEADGSVVGAVAGYRPIAIPNSSNDALYQSYRFADKGKPYRYAFPLPNGLYKVSTYFLEPYFQKTGARVFNIEAEGERVLSRYDIYKEVGFGRVTHKEFRVEVKDGKLDLVFSSVVNNAIVSALKVERLDN